MNDYPKCLQIYDADIHITFHFQNQGRFCCTSDTSKLEREKLIIADAAKEPEATERSQQL